MAELLEHWAWIIKFAAILTACGVIYNYLIKKMFKGFMEAHKAIIDLKKIYPTLEEIAKDFRPNGGHSLRDVINRIEIRMDIIDERYKLLIELEDIAIFETDIDGKYTWVSEGWMKLTDMTEVESSNYGWLAGVNMEDRGRVSQEWEMAISQERQFCMKYRMGENGHSKQVYCTAFPIKDPHGKLLGYVGRLIAVNNIKE